MVNIQQVKTSFSKCYFQSKKKKECERTAGNESFMKVRFGIQETVWFVFDTVYSCMARENF